MQFLRTMFWVVIFVAGTIFSVRNWSPVTVALWGDLVLDTHLPVLMIGSFLLGLVPVFILYRTTRWSMKRKLEAANRSLSESLAPATPEPPRQDLTAMNPPGAL
jgi:lipopolysaccharide assembly protein A